MPHYPYLIIGGGMTTDAVIRGIREVDADRAIGMVGNEPDRPYNRPPLSKGLWKGEAFESIRRVPRLAGVELHLGRKIQSLDLADKRAKDDQETIYTFGKCLVPHLARCLHADEGSRGLTWSVTVCANPGDGWCHPSIGFA